MSNGKVRCGQCDIITKRNGAPGFKFRFHKGSACGLGPSGCPSLGGGAQGTLSLPAVASFQ
jgi:hypothetical protein